MKRKVAGIVFILGSVYYLIAEAISATYFNASFLDTIFLYGQFFSFLILTFFTQFLN